MKELMLLLWSGVLVFYFVRMIAPGTVSGHEALGLTGFAVVATIAYIFDWADER
jgi:hypothetical protein